MTFDCIVRTVEMKISSSIELECSLRTAFIEYLKDRHDLLMYRHSFMFALKRLDPTEIAMQLVNNKESSLYFCEATFFLLMDSLSLKGTIFTPKQSTSSFRFADNNKFDVTQSDVVCVVANRTVYIMDGKHHAIKTCSCTVPKYRAAVDYTPRLRAPRNLPRCTANSDTYRQ